MVVKTVYVCEKCRKIYEEEEQALACENTHATPAEISEAFYSEKSAYPRDVKVKFSDGKTIKFTR